MSELCRGRLMLLSAVLWLGMYLPALADFDRYDLQIPVPVDTWLAADLYMPDTATVAMPVIFIQTPYNKNSFHQSGPPLGSEAYAYVIMDWRGKYGSSQAWEPHPEYGADGAIAIEWIADQFWCNGKIGTWGSSALGQIQYLTAKEHPEHLVCCVPINHAMRSQYRKYYHGGVKREEYVDAMSGWDWIPWLVNNHPLNGPFWDFIWNETNYVEQIHVPMLIITGWWDMNADEAILLFNDFREETPDSVRDQHMLLVGPWSHMTVGNENQGDYSYPEGRHVHAEESLLFFAHHLRGEDVGDWPAIRYFELGPDTFTTSDTWPPAGAESLPLYLSDHGLNPELTEAGVDSFPYNPRQPVPTVGGRTFSHQLDAGPAHINFINQRRDVLIYQTPELAQPLRAAGYIHVKLYVSTSRLDTDFAVFLADVYPDGDARMLTDGIRRLRFRNGYAEGEPAHEGEIYELDIPLQMMAITFQRGHRVRLYVTGSNYPRFDRNLNNGRAMYVPGDTLTALNMVHRGPDYPSALWMEVLGHGEATVFEQTDQGTGTALPQSFTLDAYPNPFNTSAAVRVTLPQPSELDVTVYNALGRRVAELTHGDHAAGQYELTLEARDLASGIYVVRATVPGESELVRKLVLLK